MAWALIPLGFFVMSCWTVASYIPRAVAHHTAHIARHVWRGKWPIARIHHHAYLPTPVATGVWKTAVVCTVTAVGGLGALGGAHLVGVPFPPVTAGQLRDALCCGQSPLTHVSGAPGTWASGVTGFAGYPDRPVRKVPEPSGALILGLGLGAIVMVRRRI